MAVLIGAGIAGLALGAGGSFLGSSDANKRRRQMRELANAPRTDVTGVERENLQSNLANLGLAEELATGTGLANTRALSAITDEGLPGFAKLRDTAFEQLQALISGELPDDVSQSVQRSAAARGITSGTAGSEFNRNLSLRDLGLTSLQATQTGLNFLPSTLGALAPLSVGNPAQAQDFFITPSQRLATEVQERELSLKIAANAIGLKTGKEVIGEGLSGLGGALLGGAAQGITQK